jgi:hypothetical protein
MGSLYDGLIESKNRVFLLEQVLGDFLKVSIQTYTQKGFFLMDLRN